MPILGLVLGTFGKEIGKELALGIAKGVGGAAGAKAFGSFLSAIGLADETAQQQLELTQEQVELARQQVALLSQISTKLDGIRSELIGIRSAINKTNELLWEIHKTIQNNSIYTNWSANHINVLSYSSTINEAFDQYLSYINPVNNEIPIVKNSTLKAFAVKVLDSPTSSVSWALTQIHDNITGIGGTAGLLSQYADVLLVHLKRDSDFTNPQANSAKYSAQLDELVNRLIEYYGALLHTQLYAISLIVEARSYQKEKMVAQNAFNIYLNNLKEQQYYFYAAMWRIISAWIKNTSLSAGALNWETDDPDFRLISARDLLDFRSLKIGASLGNTAEAERSSTPGVQDYIINAETLLSNFQLVEPNVSRIVVYGTFYSAFPSVWYQPGVLEKLDSITNANTMLVEPTPQSIALPEGTLVETQYFKGFYDYNENQPIGLIRQIIDIKLNAGESIVLKPRTNSDFDITTINAYSMSGGAWENHQKKFIDGVERRVESEGLVFFPFSPFSADL